MFSLPSSEWGICRFATLKNRLRSFATRTIYQTQMNPHVIVTGDIHNQSVSILSGKSTNI
uniref:Uncharacterized protein n=1 Tax=Arundo donax TaxID=35708 RepID=A0A0A9BPM7_ARUDO